MNGNEMAVGQHQCFFSGAPPILLYGWIGMCTGTYPIWISKRPWPTKPPPPQKNDSPRLSSVGRPTPRPARLTPKKNPQLGFREAPPPRLDARLTPRPRPRLTSLWELAVELATTDETSGSSIQFTGLKAPEMARKKRQGPSWMASDGPGFFSPA